MRSNQTLVDAENWFKVRNIPLYGVQKHPTQHEWTNSTKAHGHLCIDDRNAGCPLVFDHTLSDKKFVNWDVIEKMYL